ncbi:hypothetical protein GN244_ATG12081 [Phytophthora infestans]|uniref:Uncharacterized protein n=1 Tax=Phytophthora infestans TaxID=4787 RepID=A0A833SZ57_PHYIN|nr:hypothetical protein GN244_ATG12081 [Phytophthora infestans]
MTRQLGIPGQQARRIGLRPVQAVDYVRAVQGIAKDHSIDEDYNEEEERADGGDAGAVDAMVNANAVYAVDNVNDTDDADTVAVEDDDKKLFGDSDDDVDDLVRNDGAATGADKRLSVDAAGDASTGFDRTVHEFIRAARSNAEAEASTQRHPPPNSPKRKEKKRRHAPDDDATGGNASLRKRAKSLSVEVGSVALASQTTMLPIWNDGERRHGKPEKR